MVDAQNVSLLLLNTLEKIDTIFSSLTSIDGIVS
jgi:hypothetical protein